MEEVHTEGFSLVELSIVLVILGLLTGGILAGQSLIRAAELRGVNTEYSRYVTAFRTFQDKYFAKPGDMTNATSFWGSLGGTGSDQTCQDLPATGAPTCNGNGSGSLLTALTGAPEHFRTWQHLVNAGLIEGRYSGITGAYVAGGNVPGSKLSKGLWQMRLGPGCGSYSSCPTTTTGGSTNYYHAGDYGVDLLALSSAAGSSNTAGSYPLRPEEAWNIDTKMDDGKPQSGKVRGMKGDATNTNCSTTAGTTGSDSTAEYKLSATSLDCWLMFPSAF